MLSNMIIYCYFVNLGYVKYVLILRCDVSVVRFFIKRNFCRLILFINFIEYFDSKKY